MYGSLEALDSLELIDCSWCGSISKYIRSRSTYSVPCCCHFGKCGRVSELFLIVQSSGGAQNSSLQLNTLLGAILQLSDIERTLTLDSAMNKRASLWTNAPFHLSHLDFMFMFSVVLLSHCYQWVSMGWNMILDAIRFVLLRYEPTRCFFWQFCWRESLVGPLCYTSECQNTCDMFDQL